MTDRPNREPTSVDRRRIRALAVASAIMLAWTGALYVLSPSPFAPRVHIRWTEGISDAQRTALEQRFALVAGQRRQDTTWEYDLTEVAPSSVLALVNSPAVADTHYIDRGSGTVAADAPTGATRQRGRMIAGWVHSPLYEWFMLFWVSSLVVSGVWLASAANPQRH